MAKAFNSEANGLGLKDRLLSSPCTEPDKLVFNLLGVERNVRTGGGNGGGSGITLLLAMMPSSLVAVAAMVVCWDAVVRVVAVPI